MNQISTKSPIAAAILEMTSARLARLSTLKRLPGEKPNTVVLTLGDNVSSFYGRRHRADNLKIPTQQWKVAKIQISPCMPQERQKDKKSGSYQCACIIPL